MTLLDWVIVVVPVCVIMYAGWNIRKYITGVADFMVGGRICRRYVITTGNMANALGLDKDEMTAEWEELFVLQQEIVPVIRKLREKADIALLSNAPLGVVEGLLDRYALWDLFDETVISCNVKMAKPDERIYKHCISLFNKKYDKIYMVDDNLVNLEHLPSIGITPIHYRNVEDLNVISD